MSQTEETKQPHSIMLALGDLAKSLESLDPRQLHLEDQLDDISKSLETTQQETELANHRRDLGKACYYADLLSTALEAMDPSKLNMSTHQKNIADVFDLVYFELKQKLKEAQLNDSNSENPMP